jgi:hypothetical protein
LKSTDQFGKQARAKDGLRWTCKECNQQAGRRYMTPLRNLIKRLARFGLTIASYLAMSKAQNDCCAACGRPEWHKQHGTLQKLAIDHDHETGNIRALLCRRCNTTLGQVEEDPQVLAALIGYLNKYKPQPEYYI